MSRCEDFLHDATTSGSGDDLYVFVGAEQGISYAINSVASDRVITFEFKVLLIRN